MQIIEGYSYNFRVKTVIRYLKNLEAIVLQKRLNRSSELSMLLHGINRLMCI